MGLSENLQFDLDSEFHSLELNVAYGEEEKIFINKNTSVLIVVQKYYFAIFPFSKSQFCIKKIKTFYISIGIHKILISLLVSSKTKR